MLRTLRIRVAIAILAAAGSVAPAAELEPSASADPAPSSPTTPLEEVEVTAQHHKLDWSQHNDLVQKAATYVYGITAVGPEAQIARWRIPVCPYLSGLLPEEGKYILKRIWTSARAAGGAWLAGKAHCQPNLRIYVTQQPKTLLQNTALLGGATPSKIDQFIDQPGPVWVWHNGGGDGYGIATYGPVVVVVDRARLAGVSQKQLADYLAMVSLAEIKPTAHLGDAETILKLFTGAPESAPQSLSEWDQTFLRMLYTPQWSLAKERSNIARRMVRALNP